MTTPSDLPPAAPAPGYLSDDSKRRFTIVAGVLGVVFFLAQFALPMIVMFAFMMPMAFGTLSTTDLDRAALWRGELWAVERTVRTSWRKPTEPTTILALARVRLDDLSEAGPAVPLAGVAGTANPSLLATPERLWLIGEDELGYYENGALTRLSGAGHPARASKPLAYGGRPAVVSLGSQPTLSRLQVDGTRAEWVAEDLVLALPPEAGELRALQALEVDGSLYLFAQLCTRQPDRCSLSYRELHGQEWRPLVDDLCSCGTWTPIPSSSRPAVVFSERVKDRSDRTVMVTAGTEGPRREVIEPGSERQTFVRWQPFTSGNTILLLGQGLPGGLRLAEVSGGRVTRTAKKAGSFPFGPNMMLLMALPQLLPFVLSLLLAFILTAQMRRHRIPDYVVGPERRRFASLWQRALAQLVDVIPFAAAFLLPILAMWQMVADPEDALVERGANFPWLFFGLFAAAFAWSFMILLAYSASEGRYGKTPGKWLLRIRVLGTDLQPCGFWRALLRNILTLADGFFSFLVGALLVALTENWQRLGDMAARTVVLTDDSAG